MKKASVYSFVPVTVKRKISQNLADKFKSNYLGTEFISPGGSGNYQVFVGVLFKL